MDIGNEAIFSNPRIEVSFVGFLATWWFGLLIGIIIGLVGLIHQNGKIMFSVSIKAICITIMTTFILGIIGLIIGKFYLANIEINWYDISNNL